MWGRISALIVKEILVLLKDPRARYVLIVPPLIQLFIFAFAATLDVKDVPIGILNRDQGGKSIELVERFWGSQPYTKVTFLQSVSEIKDFIDMQKGVMVLSIDETFSRNIEAKKQATVQLIFDGRKSNAAQIVAGYSGQIIEQFSKDITQERMPSQLFTRNWYNPNLLYYWYNVPSLAAVLTMALGLIVTSLSVAREREMGTFDQLLVSPAQPFEIMVGKMLPAVLIALAEASVIVLVAIFIFQIPFTGHLWLLYLGLFVFVLSIVGIGLFISSLCSTQQQAILGTFCFMSPAVLLSGFATPIENMPFWLQQVTAINPLRYMLVIARGEFLKAMPADIVFANIWPMALIGLCTLTASTWLFRRKLA